MYRSKYPLKLSDGEVVCPRKSGPFPSVIGALTCLQMRRQNKAACDEHGCREYTKSLEHGGHLNKHAREAVQSLIPDLFDEEQR